MLKIKLNEDNAVVEEIKQALKNNEGYCPCRILRTPDNKCMCKEFRDQQTEGLCHCGLYRKIRESN